MFPFYAFPTFFCSVVLDFVVCLLKFMSIELVMLSNHLILCCPLLLLPSIFSVLWPPDMKSRLTGKDQLVYRGINWLQKWCGKCKTVQPVWKTAGQCLAKLNMLLPFDPEILLLGIYPTILGIYSYPHLVWVATMFIQEPAGGHF